MIREGDSVTDGLRTMAEAITYADLRFVKKSVSSRLGQGKGNGYLLDPASCIRITHLHPQTPFLTPALVPLLSRPRGL